MYQMSKTKEVFRQNTTKMISKGKGRNSDDTIKVACEGELEKSMSFVVSRIRTMASCLQSCL